MNIESMGRFAKDLNNLTERSLRPVLEGSAPHDHSSDTAPVSDVPWDKRPEGARGNVASHGSFGTTLEGMMQEVSSLQRDAVKGSERMLTGEVEDVHQVMVAVEKASTSFMLMMEIRNKLVEAYREVMRMQA